MKTFIIVPDNALRAKLAMQAQAQLAQKLKQWLSGYTTQHEVSVIRHLGDRLTELWTSIDEHAWSRTTALYQTYSIIRQCLGDNHLLGVVSGRVSIPNGIRSFNLPVIGKVNTTFIRCLAYDAPVLYRVNHTGRSEMLELSFSMNPEPIEATQLFQELQHAMDNFSR